MSKQRNQMFRGYSVFDNSLDAFIPEFWANEALVVLEENLVAANLVYRDFENQLARFGDTVNCQRPNRFEPVRKTNADNVTIQDATAENVPVVLNQHIHTSFLIKDGEESKSKMDLINTYIAPAVKGMARFIDRLVLGQYGQFIRNQVGYALGGTTSNSKSILVSARTKAENLLWPEGEMRPMILNPDSEGLLLNTDLFVSAEQVGDNGTALRNASLGKKFGFSMLKSQQMGNIPTGNTSKAGAVNNASGYAAGTTSSMTVDGFTGAVATGAWVNFGGFVTRITAHTETLGNTTAITLLDALPYDIADNAVIREYTPGAVNNASGYAAGYAKAIVVDGFTVAPKVGQMVTFTSSPSITDAVYTIVGTDVSTTSITLDRPLEAAIADNAPVNIGPAGDYSFSFLRDAMALVVRPLAAPKEGTGARAAVVNYNGLAMRAVITYDGNKQGHLVTLDVLLGIKVLNDDMGLVMLF